MLTNARMPRCRECRAVCLDNGDYCDDKCRTIGALRHEIAGLRVIDRNLDRVEQQLAEARAAGAVLTLENEHLREGLLRAMRALAEPDRTDAQRNFHAYEVAEIALLECGSAPAAPEGGEV